MSTLTKVFVVLLALSSIAFTTAAISITAQMTHWRQVASGFEQQLRVSDARIESQDAAHAAQLATLRDTIGAQLSRIEQLETDLESNKTVLAQKETALKQAVAERSSFEALNRGLLGQLQVSQKNEETTRQQRDRLEAQNLNLQTRNIQLNERVNEQTAQIAVLVEQRRHYDQQIDLLKKENAGLARQANALGTGAKLESPRGEGLPGVRALTPVASSAVRGKVVQVDGDIITLSVGSADGVEKGMVFVISRGGDYVGDVKISAIQPNQCAGRLSEVRMQPKPDDQVVDQGHLALASNRG